jgi:carboxyl-terminal processing protease
MERAKLTPIASGPSVSEADLEGHLANGNGGPDGGGAERSETGGKELRDQDFQLYEALNLLRGIALSRGSTGAPG